jgi:hypothetical protein
MSSSEVSFEPIVRKVGCRLRIAELESEFLSNESTKTKMDDIVKSLYKDLNERGEGNIPIDKANSIVFHRQDQLPAPPEVLPHHVPVCVSPALTDIIAQTDSDLCLRTIGRLIDGVKSVYRIANVADMDLDIACTALRGLLHYNLIAIIDIFQFSNRYRHVPDRLRGFMRSVYEWEADRIAKALRYMTFDEKPLPSLHDVIAILLDFGPSRTVADVCKIHEAKLSQINIRRLVTFCLINGLVERIHDYVLQVNPGVDLRDTSLSHLSANVLEMVRVGGHCYDEFSCVLKCGKAELDKIFRTSPDVVVISK